MLNDQHPKRLTGPCILVQVMGKVSKTLASQALPDQRIMVANNNFQKPAGIVPEVNPARPSTSPMANSVSTLVLPGQGHPGSLLPLPPPWAGVLWHIPKQSETRHQASTRKKLCFSWHISQLMREIEGSRCPGPGCGVLQAHVHCVISNMGKVASVTRRNRSNERTPNEACVRRGYP